jgi:pimeloyl-ACP methyl ester carboxylesterase
MSELPTLVFIPGAWHKPTCYVKVIEILQKQYEIKCVSLVLPTTADDPAATFNDDLEATREVISNETTHGRDVVVIAHSYGGMVGNSAIKGFTQPETVGSQDRSRVTGCVIGLILIASGFTLTGMTFMDPFFGHPPPSWRVNSVTGYAEIVTEPGELFYHDLSAEEAKYWVSQLTTQSLRALFEGGANAYAGWMDVPSWYIGTIEDRALPVLAQRLNVGMARQMGASVEHRELQASHSPFLSRPEATVKIMLEAVNSFACFSEGKNFTAPKCDDVIVVPKATLWQPLTWLTFGLPLFVGHLLGRCFLIFGAGRRLWRSMFSQERL